jgi:cellulose synthase/poly-beta-1,6-N-acetylglucosamine synthase-like glycosyltransferase
LGIDVYTLLACGKTVISVRPRWILNRMALSGPIAVIVVVLGSFASLYLLNYVFLAIVSWMKSPRLKGAAVVEWPNVSIHVPVYNERYVVGRLLDALAELEYPSEKLQVVVVDDSTDDTTSIVSEAIKRNSGTGIEFLHIRRGGRWGFKAGALQEALKISRGEFIAIFDSDFVPPKNFLRDVIPYLMSDERVAAVQVRWEHLNRESSFLTQGQALSLDLHFEVEQRARSAASFFLNFNGTAGVWRRRCIEEAGGWRPFLAEDLELSLRAQLRGWRIVYIPEPACPGELPPQMEAAKRQQYRWAYGAIEAAKAHLASILRSSLGWGVKLQAFLHLTRHVPQLLFLVILMLTPLAVLLGVPTGNVFLSASWALISAVLVSATLGVRSLKELPQLILFTTSMTLNNSLAVIEALLGRKIPFHRTPKFGEGEWRGKRYILPLDFQSYFEVALGAALVATAFFATLKALYGYVVYTSIAGVSLMYAGLLSIYHAPRSEYSGLTARAKVLRILILLMLALAIFGSVIGYYQTYYRLDVASSYLVRGASSSDAAEIARYIEAALTSLPREGNPVWILPTPRTDFRLITSDLEGLRDSALRLAAEGASSPTYQQGIDQIKDSLKIIRDQVMEAAIFYYISPSALLSTALWLVGLALLIRTYLRERSRSAEQ